MSVREQFAKQATEPRRIAENELATVGTMLFEITGSQPIQRQEMRVGPHNGFKCSLAKDDFGNIDLLRQRIEAGLFVARKKYLPNDHPRFRQPHVPHTVQCAIDTENLPDGIVARILVKVYVDETSLADA